MKESVNINWRQLRDMTNMTRENFERCKKYLSNYTDNTTADKIRRIIQKRKRTMNILFIILYNLNNVLNLAIDGYAKIM